MTKCIIITAAIFFLLAGIAAAEPDSMVNYLMNEPYTLFDFGMRRINEDLHKYPIPNSEREAYKTARYNWDRNRIEVVLVLMETKDSEEAEKYCRAWVKHYRPRLYVNILGGAFTHRGFRRKEQPEHIGQKMCDITEIKCVAPYKEKGKILSKVCKGMESEEIYCTTKKGGYMKPIQ
jgi:hypothetical protein